MIISGAWLGHREMRYRKQGRKQRNHKRVSVFELLFTERKKIDLEKSKAYFGLHGPPQLLTPKSHTHQYSLRYQELCPGKVHIVIV